MPLDENRKRHYRFVGEEESEGLIGWLNSKERLGSTHRRRIGELIEDMNRTAELSSLGAPDGDLLEKIDQVLSRYWLRVETFAPEDTGRSFKTIPEFRWLFLWSSNAGVEVAEVILTIVSLGKRGLLGRVRRCGHCQTWFYARFNHQRFCSNKCQLAKYQTSEEWKEKRRQRYHDQKR